MNTRRVADRRLATLERWRALELEQTQTERAALDDAARRERDSAAELERHIEDTREAARTLIAESQRFSAATLLETGRYALSQERALDRQHNLLQEAERRAEDARAAVIQSFKNLTVLEKLRERRGREHGGEMLRLAQKVLDDQAILVLGARCTDPTSTR